MTDFDYIRDCVLYQLELDIEDEKSYAMRAIGEHDYLKAEKHHAAWYALVESFHRISDLFDSMPNKGV